MTNLASNPPLEFMADLVREVGREVLQKSKALEPGDIHYKARTDIVTDVDIWCERTLSDRLLKAFPGSFVFGEETHAALGFTTDDQVHDYLAQEMVWLIDPIDGTSNFANGIPHFAISVGLLSGGQRVAGVVFDPSRNELFQAAKGSGAFLNGNPIAVSTKRELLDGIVAISFASSSEKDWSDYLPLIQTLIRNSRSIRLLGCATLTECWVACGRLEAAFEHRIKPWDVAAASLIVEEAGGVALNPSHPLSSTADTLKDVAGFSLLGPDFLTTTPNLKEQLQKLLQV